MYKIKKATLLSIVDAAKNTYPNEFFSLLGGDRKKKIIDEFIVVPAQYGKTFTVVKVHLIPFDQKIVGSVHSHPSPNPFPSKGDLNTFSKFGEIHLIIAHPFNLNTVKAFNREGAKVSIGVIE